jgi:hypothetical protein
LGLLVLVDIVFSMTAHQNFAFKQLLSSWRRREDARSAQDLAELGQARISLDSARTQMSTALIPPAR